MPDQAYRVTMASKALRQEGGAPKDVILSEAETLRCGRDGVDAEHIPIDVRRLDPRWLSPQQRDAFFAMMGNFTALRYLELDTLPSVAANFPAVLSELSLRFLGRVPPLPIVAPSLESLRVLKQLLLYHSLSNKPEGDWLAALGCGDTLEELHTNFPYINLDAVPQLKELSCTYDGIHSVTFHNTRTNRIQQAVFSNVGLPNFSHFQALRSLRMSANKMETSVNVGQALNALPNPALLKEMNLDVTNLDLTQWNAQGFLGLETLEISNPPEFLLRKLKDIPSLNTLKLTYFSSVVQPDVIRAILTPALRSLSLDVVQIKGLGYNDLVNELAERQLTGALALKVADWDAIGRHIKVAVLEKVFHLEPAQYHTVRKLYLRAMPADAYPPHCSSLFAKLANLQTLDVSISAIPIPYLLKLPASLRELNITHLHEIEGSQDRTMDPQSAQGKLLIAALARYEENQGLTVTADQPIRDAIDAAKSRSTGRDGVSAAR